VSRLTREDRLQLRAEAELIRIRYDQLETQLIDYALEGWPGVFDRLPERVNPFHWRHHRRAQRIFRQQRALDRRLQAIHEAFPGA
jgi:hypothetical protein